MMPKGGSLHLGGIGKMFGKCFGNTRGAYIQGERLGIHTSRGTEFVIIRKGEIVK